MSRSAIHTFVCKGRYGIKEKLGFPSNVKTISSTDVISSSNDTG